MSSIKNKNGYTMTEVMIVLAVTGAMFAATVLLVQGQIAKTAFRSSAYNTEQMLAGVMNDVRVGYFNSATSPDTVAVVNMGLCGNAAAGKSDDCEYAGKRVTITSDDRTIKTEDLFIKFPGNLTPESISSTEVVNDLPNGLDFKSGEVYEFDVLLSNTVNDGVGAQKIFVDVTLPVEICASNGSREVKFIVGTNGSPIVETKYEAC